MPHVSRAGIRIGTGGGRRCDADRSHNDDDDAAVTLACTRPHAVPQVTPIYNAENSASVTGIRQYELPL